MAVRVLLVDDHEIMREGMCALLRRCEDIEVVGQAGNGRAAVELVERLDPDVVIMDIGMPNLNGIDATRQMKEKRPHLKVMALSTHSNRGTVVQMINAGANGYMLKESAFSELQDGIATMLEGHTFLCRNISKVIFTDYINLISNPQMPDNDGLSGREREVLQLVAEGHTTKEIAKILHLSPKTVDSHREHIMKKLRIRTIAGLTKYAVREGLTTP
ncbi:MAG: response regulator transcription factor [Planctomycetes bacterium]|jgi:two-component system response regulator NreC|nr:response regulator transcription factor [Planctomycetota bacterium]